MKFSSSAPFKLPGITSRFTKGRNTVELPISRQSCTPPVAAFRSSGWDIISVSIWTRSVGLGPVSRILPRLFGRTIPANIDQEPAGALYLASISAAANGTSARHVCMSGVSRLGSLFQKKVSEPVRGGSGFSYSQTQPIAGWRSEEHTSELQSRQYLV